MSHLPSVLAAQAVVTFPRAQTRKALESFFLDLLLTLFDISSVDEKLLGHIKLYGEGNSKTTIRANVTGRRESSRVEIRGSRPERYVKVWLNVVTYKLDEEMLRKRFLTAFTDFVKRRHAKLPGLRVVHHHEHR